MKPTNVGITEIIVSKNDPEVSARSRNTVNNSKKLRREGGQGSLAGFR